MVYVGVTDDDAGQRPFEIGALIKEPIEITDQAIEVTIARLSAGLTSIFSSSVYQYGGCLKLQQD
jgi:hypothetical protein